MAVFEVSSTIVIGLRITAGGDSGRRRRYVF